MPYHLTDRQRLRAVIYGLVHRGRAGDVEFYRQQCRGASDALELGCGSGRVLRVLAAEVPSVVGLDLDEAKLELAERETPSALRPRVTLVRADMSSFRLERRFERILIPYNSLLALRDDDAVLDCFRCIRRHLTPDGQLAFDIYLAEDDPADDRSRPANEPWSYLVSVIDGDLRAEVYEREEPAPGHRTFVMAYRYKIHRGHHGEPEIIEDRIRHHLLAPKRVEELLETAGLAPVERWGDFDRTPLEPHSDRMIVVAARA